MRPDICAGSAGGGVRSCPICVCKNVCVMHCHSMQSYISVIHIDGMSVWSWFSQSTCSKGCTAAVGQYGGQPPFSLDFLWRYFYVCQKCITWRELKEAERSGTCSSVQGAVWLNTIILKRQVWCSATVQGLIFFFLSQPKLISFVKNLCEKKQVASYFWVFPFHF